MEGWWMVNWEGSGGSMLPIARRYHSNILVEIVTVTKRIMLVGTF